MIITSDVPLDRKHLPFNWFEKLTIYDLGMHVGQDTEFYLKKGFNVIAIEANPSLCEMARLKFHDFIEQGKLTILNIGISDRHGSMEFYINSDRTEWSSFHKSISGRDGNEPIVANVEVSTLASLIDEYGVPYYLKIDIEGNDSYALHSVLSSQYHVPYISVENGSTMLNDFLNYRYSRFKYIQQNNVTTLRQEPPALEGKIISHQFPFGASGKFGEETEGPWLDYEQVYELVSKVWDIETGAKNPDWNDGESGWFDLHARHDDFNSILLEMIK